MGIWTNILEKTNIFFEALLFNWLKFYKLG